MSRPPLKVLLLCDGPADGPGSAAFLESLLALHGGFQVRRDGEGDGQGHDAVLVSTRTVPRLDEVPADPGVPVIVLARWQPDAAQVEAMVEEGAEDVLVLAEATAVRLESAVRKALGRRVRARAPRLPEIVAGLRAGSSWAAADPEAALWAQM